MSKDMEAELPDVAPRQSAGAQQSVGKQQEEDEIEAPTGMVLLPLIIYNLFEDPAFFSLGVFGNGQGKPNAKGIPFRLASMVIVWVINILILMSTLAFCLESVAQFSPDPHTNPENWKFYKDRWGYIEVLCVVCFTVDICIRFFGALAAGTKYAEKFLSDWMNANDILAILPFYIDLMFGGGIDLRFLRTLRLVRILNTLPAARHGNLIGLIVNIITGSASALMIPVFFMSLSMVVLSAITYNFEKTVSHNCYWGDGTTILGWVPEIDAVAYPDDSADGGVWVGEQSPDFGTYANAANAFSYNAGCLSDFSCACPGTITYLTYDGTEWSSELFSSIPHVGWWCIVTFTTVGYGDVNPRTAWGQTVCALTMFIGLFFIAMPLTIVGDKFTELWNKFDKNREKNFAEERRNDAAMLKAEEIRSGITATAMDGPHDVLHKDILMYFVKAKNNLKTMRPADEDDGASWDNALKQLELVETQWIELYGKVKQIAS